MTCCSVTQGGIDLKVWVSEFFNKPFTMAPLLSPWGQPFCGSHFFLIPTVRFKSNKKSCWLAYRDTPLVSTQKYCLMKIWNASRICVSSLRRGHANLLCIVPILVYVLPKQVHGHRLACPYIRGSQQPACKEQCPRPAHATGSP